MNNNHGVSLVETLIYVAILSLIISGLFSFSLTISANRNKAYAVQEVQSNIRSMVTAVKADMRAATAVTSPTAGNTGPTLILDMGTNPDITYSVVDNVFYRTAGVGDPVAISTSRSAISGLIFKNLATTNDRDNIELIAVITYADGSSRDFSYSQNLQTTFSTKK